MNALPSTPVPAHLSYLWGLHRFLAPEHNEQVSLRGRRWYGPPFGLRLCVPLTLLADKEQLQVYGSRAYAPPELEDRVLTTASDVWALGCLVYEMCTCSLLFVDAVQESRKEFQISDIALQTLSYQNFASECCPLILQKE